MFTILIPIILSFRPLWLSLFQLHVIVRTSSFSATDDVYSSIIVKYCSLGVLTLNRFSYLLRTCKCYLIIFYWNGTIDVINLRTLLFISAQVRFNNPFFLIVNEFYLLSKVIIEIAYTPPPPPLIINSYGLYYFHFHYKTLLTVSLHSIKPSVSHRLVTAPVLTLQYFIKLSSAVSPSPGLYCWI